MNGPITVPAVDTDGTVYVTRPDGLHAIAASDGAVKWIYADGAGQPVMTTTGLIVATCRSNNQLCAVDRNGALAWQMSTSYPLLGAATIDSNNVIHQMTSNGNYLRVSASGSLINAAIVPIASSFDYPLVLDGGLVYMGSNGSHWLAYNNATGLAASPWPTRHKDTSSRRNAGEAPVSETGAPFVQISTVPSNPWMAYRANKPMNAIANDYRDGDLTSTIEWISSRDGEIAHGGAANLSVLSAGTHTITARVEDSNGLQAEQSFNMTVQYEQPRMTVTAPTYQQKYEIGYPAELRATSIDPIDGDISSQIQWTSDRDGLLGTGSIVNRVLSTGTHLITVTSTNSVGITATYVASGISITHLPPAVVISSPGSSSVTPATTVTFAGTAMDLVDGDLSAQLRWTSLFDGVLHTGSTFDRSGLSVGSNTFYAEVTDSHGLTGTDIGTIVVSDPNNEAPWVSVSIDSGSSNYGQPATFLAYSGDYDGTVVGLPQWYSNRDGFLGSGTQLTISTLSVGEHRIHAVVTDNLGAKAARVAYHTVRSN